MAKVCFIILLLACACRPVHDSVPEPEPSPDPIVIIDTLIYCPEDVVKAFLDTIESYIGITELTGRNDGPEIAAMLAVCGIGEGNPWCAAKIAKGLIMVGKTPPNACAWSPSYFPDNKIVWRKGEVKLIPEGAIFGLWFNNMNRIAHVGVVKKDTGRGWIITMEGNTNADGSRDGNMAAVRMRRKSQIHIASDWLK
jgi:hypothetical protein